MEFLKGKTEVKAYFPRNAKWYDLRVVRIFFIFQI